MPQEQLHPLPLHRAGRTREQRTQPLAQAGGLRQQTGSDHGQRGRPQAKDRSRSERAHHLVVADVKHPEITLPRRAVPGDFADHMGIDCRHRRVHHLERMIRVARPQHPLELPWEAIGRLRVSHCRRLPKNKNADGVRRLRRGQGQGLRRARYGGWEEAPAEFGILYEPGGRLLALLQEEGRGIAVARQAQPQFARARQEESARTAPGRETTRACFAAGAFGQWRALFRPQEAIRRCQPSAAIESARVSFGASVAQKRAGMEAQSQPVSSLLRW